MATRIFEIARELGVTSKVVMERCRAEGLEVKNHMSAVSVGLEATIREWFTEGRGPGELKGPRIQRLAPTSGSGRATLSASSQRPARIFELAREFGVTSKVVIEKCRAEGLNIQNHMTTVSTGLAATIREWFSEPDAAVASLRSAKRPTPKPAMIAGLDAKKLSRWALLAIGVRCLRRAKPLLLDAGNRLDFAIEALTRSIETKKPCTKKITEKWRRGYQSDIRRWQGESRYKSVLTQLKSAFRAAHELMKVTTKRGTRSRSTAMGAIDALIDSMAKVYGNKATEAVVWDYYFLAAIGPEFHLPRPAGASITALGPLWPLGCPSGYEAPAEDLDARNEIHLEIELPEDASDDEVISTIAELAEKADSVHREYGGQGLTVKRVEVLRELAVPVGVDR